MIPPLSILDLCPIVEGGDARGAFSRSVTLAQRAEALGFRRFWLAEHHNMPGIASAATSLVIAHVAAATTTISPRRTRCGATSRATSISSRAM